MRFILLYKLLLFSIVAFAQPVQIEWQDAIGGSGEDYLRVFKPLSDGNYIVAGFSRSGISGDKTVPNNGERDFWIFKMNPSGNIIWQRGYGGDAYDELFGIEETSDGGFIMGGRSTSGISGDKTTPNFGVSDYWVLRTDSNGTIQWQVSLGGSSIERLYGIKQADDGGFIVGGYSYSNISGNKTEDSNGLADFWIVKLSATGSIIWQNTIGGSEFDSMWDLVLTPDGGALLAGSSESGVSGDKTEPVNGIRDMWLVKVDSDGIIEWDKTIGGDGADDCEAIIRTSDGGYLLGGQSTSGISGDKSEPNYGGIDYWVLKIDSSANILWQNTIGGTWIDRIQAPNIIQETLDDGYIIGGHSYSNAGVDKSEDSRGEDDYWILKLNSNGEVQWDKTLGGDGRDLMRSLIQKPDANFIAAGRSASQASGDKTEVPIGPIDFWILELSPTLNIIDQQLSESLIVYPNPVENRLTFRVSGFTIDKVNILDITGRLISSSKPQQSLIDVSDLQTGTYLIEFISGEKATVKKIVKN